jgi:hypothetical protein
LPGRIRRRRTGGVLGRLLEPGGEFRDLRFELLDARLQGLTAGTARDGITHMLMESWIRPDVPPPERLRLRVTA